jgi:hypothetical protein
MAKILLEQNQVEEARSYLLISNDIWVNADPEFEDAQEARKLYENL